MMKSGTLLESMQLRKMDEHTFEGDYFDIGTCNIFGGHVLAQSVLSAYHTISEDRFLHSLHGYFLLPGDPSQSIVYKVDRVRDGGSFSNRIVSVFQQERRIFFMAASFQKEEQGYDHQEDFPEVLPPQAVRSFDEIKKEIFTFLPKSGQKLLEMEFPFEFKPLDTANPMFPGKHAPQRRIWFRFREQVELTRPLQEALLAYVSDYNLLSTAILPHEEASYSNTLMASIDHAMWFFRPFDVCDWNLYSVRSPTAISSRGFTVGAMHDQTGNYIARVGQEGLIRKMG